jgi:hypothetical protein
VKRSGTRRARAGAKAPAKNGGLVEAARGAWSVAIRIGAKPHRFIRVWAVVVGGRIYARSWSLSAGGWYRTLVAEKEGLLQVGRHTAPFRGVHARGEAVRAAVDRAYLAKYSRPMEVRYTRDLCGPASRGSTVELRLGPASPKLD